jgi:predicted SprT family Zn-dependent metalloprotease
LPIFSLLANKPYCEIELALKVLTSADRLRDTLLHEMCHAATWIISGKRDGHGKVFKSWGQQASNTFPELPPTTRCHNYVIDTKYAYICNKNCGNKIMRHSKSFDTSKRLCGKCPKNDKGKFILHMKNENSGAYEPYYHISERQKTIAPSARGKYYFIICKKKKVKIHSSIEIVFFSL